MHTKALKSFLGFSDAGDFFGAGNGGFEIDVERVFSNENFTDSSHTL